jgi:phage recombination protein Bet
MNNELVKKELITPEIILEYLDAFGLTDQLETKEKNQFVQVACAFQLNPLKREVYVVPYTSKQTGKRTLSIIVGFEVYLKRAEKSGQLSGWKAWTEGEGQNLKALVEINRRDWKAPLKHEVYMKEYAQDNKMWRDKPITMIKKVAVAQAFRLAFPCDCGGLPYEADELPLEDIQIKTIEQTNKQLETVTMAVEAAEEVTKETKKGENIFNNALSAIPRAHNADLLMEMQKRIDQRYQEGLLSEDQIKMLGDKIKTRVEELLTKEFNK